MKNRNFKGLYILKDELIRVKVYKFNSLNNIVVRNKFGALRSVNLNNLKRID